MSPLVTEYAAPKDGREGRPFTLRLKVEDEKTLRDLMFRESQLPYGHPSRHAYGDGLPYAFSLGSFLVWAAKQWRPAAAKAATRSTRSYPPAGKTRRRRRRPPRPGKTRLQGKKRKGGKSRRKGRR